MSDQNERKIAALEGLVNCLLKNDRHSIGKNLLVAVSETNDCKIEFNEAPTKTEIDALIEHLKFFRTLRPDVTNRVTLDEVNKALERVGVTPIE